MNKVVTVVALRASGAAIVELHVAVARRDGPAIVEIAFQLAADVVRHWACATGRNIVPYTDMIIPRLACAVVERMPAACAAAEYTAREGKSFEECAQAFYAEIGRAAVDTVSRLTIPTTVPATVQYN